MVTNIDHLKEQSLRLRSLFGWAVGLGSFLFLTQIIYIPLKGVIMAVDTPKITGELEKLAVVAIQSLPTVALLIALATARQLFNIYANGPLLSAQGGRLLGRIGDWLTLSAFLSLIVGPANAPLDTVTGLYVSIQLALICVGLAIRFLGKVQAIAADIAADHAQIV